MLLGENTPISQSHSPETGNYFIHYSDNDSPNNYTEWLDSKYQEANQVLTLLQLLRDGIIDIDYYSIYFTPNFVNKIRRFGNFYFGDIKKTIRTNKYSLSKENINTLIDYHKVQAKFAKRLQNANSQLGKVLTLAQRHYANYHSKEIKEEQFLDLIIAIDSLYSPSDTMELSYRIKQYAGIFLGKDNNGKEIYDFLSKIIIKRGILVHGGLRKSKDDAIITDDEVNKLASIVRKSILGFTTLYLKGEDKLDIIHDRVQDAVFNHEEAIKLREESDPDKFVKDTLKE